MAGIRHLIDTEAHKALFEELRAEFGDDVGTVIQALGEHNSASDAHGATPYPDPNTIMRRDAAGRVRVADPVHQKDVVNKGYVDANIPDFTGYLQPSMTSSATLNGTTENAVFMTNIVHALGLEIGDVIRIGTGVYNKLHTVEAFYSKDHILVNFEHAGNRGNGSLRLPDTTTNVTVTRVAKWYNAPVGLGQAWVDVAASRRVRTTYTNTTGKPIQLNIVFDAPSRNDFYLDGHTMAIGGGSNATIFINSIIQNGISYRIGSVYTPHKWLELR